MFSLFGGGIHFPKDLVMQIKKTIINMFWYDEDTFHSHLSIIFSYMVKHPWDKMIVLASSISCMICLESTIV